MELSPSWCGEAFPSRAKAVELKEAIQVMETFPSSDQSRALVPIILAKAHAIAGLPVTTKQKYLKNHLKIDSLPFRRFWVTSYGGRPSFPPSMPHPRRGR